MQKKISFSSLLIAILLLSQACQKPEDRCTFGYGEIERQPLFLPPIEGIELNIDAKVFLNYDRAQKVEIEAQGNVYNNIERKIQDGIWEIDFENCMLAHQAINIYISLPQLTLVENNDEGEIYTETLFENQDEITIRNNRSGYISLKAEAQQLNTDLNASGNIKLFGTTNYNYISLSGSGNIRSYDCINAKAEVLLSGSGDVRLNVTEELSGEISGSGDILYIGNPVIDILASGKGELINMN